MVLALKQLMERFVKMIIVACGNRLFFFHFYDIGVLE